MDGQTERRQESNQVTLALKCDIWWQYYNDFPDTQTDQISCIFVALKFLSFP